MVRTILTPDNTHIEFDIPAEYVGKTIEVTYLALDELKGEKSKKTLGDFWGILSNETANELREHVKKVREEWDRDI
jgi:hypothetical protein